MKKRERKKAWLGQEPPNVMKVLPPPTLTPLPSSKGVGVGGGKASRLKGSENVNVAQEKRLF